MSPLPPPPVPQKLREMLKDYPGHVVRLQDVLDSMLTKPSHGIDPFDRAIWKLEGRLETFISEARDELQAAEASGDPVAIERAEAKLDLMFDARSGGRGMLNPEPLWDYFQTYKEVLE